MRELTPDRSSEKSPTEKLCHFLYRSTKFCASLEHSPVHQPKSTELIRFEHGSTDHFGRANHGPLGGENHFAPRSLVPKGARRPKRISGLHPWANEDTQGALY